MAVLQPVIQSRILAAREQRVMLDADLAEAYDVQTKVLVQPVFDSAYRSFALRMGPARKARSNS